MRNGEHAGARETRNTRTRPALHAALLSLLEEKGFDEVTVREITARAQIGYATFFRHYPDKETLLHELAAELIDRLLELTQPLLYTVDSRTSTQALCAFVWDQRRVWTALLTGGAAPILKDEFIRQARQLAMRQPQEDASIPVELKVLIPVSGTVEILSWWLRQPEPLPVERMAELLDRMIVQPAMGAAALAKPAHAGANER